MHFFRFLYFAPASNEPQDRNTKQHSDWSWCTVMHSDDLEVGVRGVLGDQFDVKERCCLLSAYSEHGMHHGTAAGITLDEVNFTKILQSFTTH